MYCTYHSTYLWPNINKWLFFIFQITVADVKIVGIFEWLPVFGINVDFNKYPKLKALNDRVTTEPKIAAWIARRPESKF